MNNLINPLENLKVVSQDGITIYELETGERVVLGRELHEKLEIGWDYSTWFKRMAAYIEDDFIEFSPSQAKGQRRGRSRKEHLLYLWTAQAIAQMQRTQEGSLVAKKLAEAQGLPSEEKTENKLVVFSNDLIPVYTTDEGKQVVIGRELHGRLGITTPYSMWFDRMCERYDLIEDADYSTIFNKPVKNCGIISGRPQTDHILTLDTAKEIAMVQESSIGKAIRRKLIEIEKLASKGQLPSYKISDEIERAEAWLREARERRALEETNRVLQIDNAQLERENNDLDLNNLYLEGRVEYLQPKADGFDEFIELGECLGVRDTANLLGVHLKAFINWLLAQGFIYRGGDKNLRGKAQYLDKDGNKNRWFDEKMVFCENDKRLHRQLFITTQGQDALRRKLQNTNLSEYK